jgi:hypothetical protein
MPVDLEDDETGPRTPIRRWGCKAPIFASRWGAVDASSIGVPVRHFTRVYFAVYGFAALAMAIQDVLTPERITGATGWGHSPGWMREIACFDMFVVFISAVALREVVRGAGARSLALGLSFLSVLLAINNFTGFHENGHKRAPPGGDGPYGLCHRGCGRRLGCTGSA